jgi:hypothetical protein
MIVPPQVRFCIKIFYLKISENSRKNSIGKNPEEPEFFWVRFFSVFWVPVRFGFQILGFQFGFGSSQEPGFWVRFRFGSKLCPICIIFCRFWIILDNFAKKKKLIIVLSCRPLMQKYLTMYMNLSFYFLFVFIFFKQNIEFVN